jgi:hypothetical protein
VPDTDSTEPRFGRLLVIGPAEVRKGHKRWTCRCDCGAIRVVAQDNLRSGHTLSCGCLNRVRLSQPRKHGHSKRGKKTRAFNAWCLMKQRCLDRNFPSYPRYGGRGITVCERWRDSFENFLADMGEPPPGTSIDRENNEGNYEPGNCRWATLKEQARNKRSSRLLSLGGRTQCLAAWAEEVGIGVKVLERRVHQGWSHERALTTPVRHCKPRAPRA